MNWRFSDSSFFIEVANELEKCILESKEFAIICPKTTNDFAEEGNRQHNYVASYVHQVVKGNCTVFFIKAARRRPRLQNF